MGKIKVGSIVVTIDTFDAGARFKVTEVRENVCSVVVIKRYKFPIGDAYASVGDKFIGCYVRDLFDPLKLILEKL
jgi:hypothetical protein